MGSFDKKYWSTNYANPKDMDCIGNAKAHCRYLKALLDLEHIQITTVIDLGFGLGYLFKQMLKTFLPYYAVGIEPSKHAFDLVSSSKIKMVESMEVKLLNIDLNQWAKTKVAKNSDPYDLAICTSVLQYLSDEDLKKIIPVIAKRCKYLYLTLPTDLELKYQKQELNFHDDYAFHRSQKKYLNLLRPHFTIISSRFLESKHHFDHDNTFFSDLLYRS